VQAEIHTRAETALRNSIKEIFGTPAQETNSESEYAKLGCTLMVVLPDEATFGRSLATATSRYSFDKKLKKLKRSQQEIADEYGLQPIGDGPKAAAGGVFVICLGYETEYARSLQAQGEQKNSR